MIKSKPNERFYFKINPIKPYNTLFAIIWNISEKFNIKLGRFGPFIFGEAIGLKGKHIK